MHSSPRSNRDRNHDQRGNSLVEYVMLMALIAIVCIAALSFFGQSSGNSVVHSSDCIVAASNGAAPC